MTNSAYPFTGVVDDDNNLHAVFATEREACDYLTRFGDDDDGNPFLWIVSMSEDDIEGTAARGMPLPWHSENPGGLE